LSAGFGDKLFILPYPVNLRMANRTFLPRSFHPLGLIFDLRLTAADEEAMNSQPPQTPGNSAPAMEDPAPQTAPAAVQPGVAELLAAGLQHHQAGRLAEAETHYRRILDLVPGHADALHLLGGLAYQRGLHEAAIELIGRAIERNGKDPSYHCSRGLVLQSLNRLDEAVASYDRALVLNPERQRLKARIGAESHRHRPGLAYP
jgi:tetratricopeptide (TPR) repeat protein